MACLSALLLAAVATGIPWTPDLGKALKTAAAGDRPVLVDVWAVWCAPCRVMDETTYRDPAVVEAMGAFLPVKVDADAQPIVIDRYRVEAYPTVLVLDGSGREVTRTSGLVDAPAMRALLEEVAGGWPAYVRRGDADAAQSAALASWLTAIGNPRAAIEVARRALKRPSSTPRPDLELALAEAQALTGEAKAAIPALDVLQADPDPSRRARALAARVAVERRLGHDDRARAALEELRRTDPDRAAAIADP
jgi:thioredoxin-like negative regulator of GroEL